MIKNYFKIAWRNIVNKKLYSAINIIGLTVGLAVGLLILLWVQDEMSYDQFNSKIDQIYQVNARVGTGNSQQLWNLSSGPIATYALKEVPDVVSAVRITTNYDHSLFSYGDKTLKQDFGSLLYIDDSFFKIFDYKLLKGDINKPFPADQSVIITERTAKRFFGDANPVGKIITADQTKPFVVAGVIADFSANSSIRADMLFSMNLRKKQYTANKYWKSMDNDWGNYYFTTYLQIRPDASPVAIGRKLSKIRLANQPGAAAHPVDFLLQPLSDVHLYNPDGSSAGARIVKIFSVVAALILLIACINYVNLSTALAILRSKEVSIRKIIGAARKQLFTQFVVETILYFAIALLLALGSIYALMPLYNSISGKNLHFDLFSAGVWQVIGLTILTTLIASGIYPALLLSAFNPINTLKGRIPGTGNVIFRKVLVVCQFAFSIGLIISTIVINKQLQFINQLDPGYNKEHVFSVQLHGMQDHYAAVKADLLRQPAVRGITSGNSSVVSSTNSTDDIDWDGKDPKTSLMIHGFENRPGFYKGNAA